MRAESFLLHRKWPHEMHVWPQFRSVMIWGDERTEFYHQGNALTPANHAHR